MVGTPDLSTAAWRKSSYSSQTGQCVEVAMVDGGVAIRDTKDNGAGPVHFYTTGEWNAFVKGIKRGEFDDLAS